MKHTLKKVISLLIVIAVFISISIPIQAADDPRGVLKLDTDSTGHQALKMTVDSIASISPLQAFCEGWNLRFEFGSESVDVYMPLSFIDKNGGRRDYVFPLTTGYTKSATGIQGAKSIRDKITSSADKATFDRIIKAGATVYANASIQKYSYSNGKYTPLGVYANSKAEIDSEFSEFTAAFKTNTKNDYFDLSYTFKPESPPIPDPQVNLALPINGSTVLQGTVVTFKGFGTGVHHISGFVDGQFLEEQSNPNDDISQQMTFLSNVKLDEVRDYTFQIKGRNTPNSTDEGSKLAESAIHTVHVIKPPPNSGNIYIRCFDIDTNKEIPDTAQTIPGVLFGQPKAVNYPPITAYKVQGSFQSFSTEIPDKSKMQSATSQTVTLSSSNKEAYVYFWYKSDPIIKPPPKPFNYDPIAIINNTPIAYVGDDVFVDGSMSYDEDGYLQGYDWETSGAYENIAQDSESGYTWYPKIGTYDIGLKVTDDAGDTGTDTSSVEIIVPKPAIEIDVLADKMKENRKIILDISKSKSSKRFPIDWDLTTWKIEPVIGTGATDDFGVRLEDGTVYKNVNGTAQLYSSGTWTDTGMDLNTILTGHKTVQFQARNSGQYKVTVSMTNTSDFDSTLHYYNTLDRTITVVEDLPPEADFKGAYSNLREMENPVDKTLQKYGVIPVSCTTTSPDGDPIGKRVWAARYDSDNDSAHGSSVSDAFSDETTFIPYTGDEPFTSGYRLIVDSDKDSTAEIWSYEVGKYTESLQVFEDIPDSETVKELLIPSDYKSDYVQGW